MNERDRLAIAQLKRGDICGLELLVRKYQVRALRVAYLVTGDPHMAEDIVQDAFLRVYHRARQFDTNRAFGPWFLRIVVNDAVKAASRRAHYISFDGRTRAGVTLADLLSDSNPRPEELAEQADARQVVRRALDKLPVPERAALVLRYYADLAENDIAERMDHPLGTVKWLLHRARARLRALLLPAPSDKHLG